MSTDRDVDRIVRSWLDEGVTTLPDRVLDNVLDQVPATSQRRAWWPARRFPEMNTVTRFAVAAAAVVAVVIGGLYFLPRQGNPGGGPGGVQPTSSPVASPSASSSPSGAAGGMFVAGTDLPGVPRLNFTADVPSGWTPFEFGARHGVAPQDPTGMAFFVSLIDNTFADPCLHTPRTPKVGSTVEAAATALGQLPGVTAKAPAQVTVAGKAATYVELLGPASLPCAEPYLWQDSKDADWWLLAPNETVGVWILEVEGQRVAVASRSWPETPAATKAEFQAILDSIVFTAAP
jgi:hypothetical protein